jgi:hypothetical protein
VAARNLGVVTSLLTLVETVIQDPVAKAAYAASPEAFLADHGFGDLDPADIDDAVLHAADTFPPTVAAQIVGVDGLEAAAHVDLHDLGMDSLDDWSGLDHAVLHAETPLESAFETPDPFHGDVDFDRPVAFHVTHDGASHGAGENSLTVVETHEPHDHGLDHFGPDHADLSHDEPSFADASFHEAVADSTFEPHHETSQHLLHDDLLHDDLLHDDGDLGVGDDDDQPDDFEIG